MTPDNNGSLQRKEWTKIEDMKRFGLWSGFSSFLSMFISIILFAIDYSNYGFIPLTVSIFLLFICILNAIKLHARYIQETICKLHNTTLQELWKDDAK